MMLLWFTVTIRLKNMSRRGWAGSGPKAQKTVFWTLCKMEVRNSVIMPRVKLKGGIGPDLKCNWERHRKEAVGKCKGESHQRWCGFQHCCHTD